MDNKKTLLILILLLAFSMLIRTPFISIPLERDEGVRAAIAQGMVSEGKAPYRDFYTNKPPLILFIYIIIFRIFGQSIENIHFFMYLYTLVSIVMIFLLTKMLFKNNFAAIVSAFSLSIMSISPRVFGNAANLEIFMILPIIISVMLFYRGLDRRSLVSFFFSGFFTGVAFWLKLSGIFMLFPILVFILYESFIRKTASLRYSLAILISVLGGFGLMFLIMCTYFWYYHIFDDAMLWIFKMGVTYLDNTFFFMRFWIVTKRIFLENIMLWVFAFIAIFHFLKEEKRIGTFLILWLAFSFIAVFPGFRFYPHYYIQILPPVAVLSGFGAMLISEWLKKVHFKMASLTLTGTILFLIIFIPLKTNYKFLFKYTPYQASKMIYGTNPFPEAVAVASHIKNYTTPSDSILVFGDEPEIYFYSGRKSATKHIGFFFLVQNYLYESLMQRQAWWEIKENNPKYIVFFDVRYSLLYTQRTDKYIFDKLNDLIETKYEVEGIVLTEGLESTIYLGKGCLSILKDKKGKITVWIFRRKED